MLPKGPDVTVEKYKFDDATYYIVHLGNDGSWITTAKDNSIYTTQSWTNVETGEECAISYNGPVPFSVDSMELARHVYRFWNKRKADRLKFVAETLMKKVDK